MSESATTDQRRSKDRFDLHYPVQIVPTDAEGKLEHSKATSGFCNDLSTTGLSITHPAPLPSLHAVVGFTHPTSGRIRLEVRIMWTKPLPDGSYESGFRMLRKLP